ncbi:MAG: TetR/AcrR family transcriptional regulator [Candidatus Thorarchaeota archaeon]
MSPKVSDEHKTMMKEKILSAALSLFSKKGYHETSMDDIVDKSGFSKGAIYGYFDSKETLFLELQKNFATINYNQLKSVIDNEPTALAKLERTADLVFASMCEVSEEMCRMDLEFQVASSRLPKMRKQHKQQQMAVIKLLEDVISEGIETGEFRKDVDANSLATILIGAIGGLSNLLVTAGFSFRWENIKNTLVSTVRIGIVN